MAAEPTTQRPSRRPFMGVPFSGRLQLFTGKGGVGKTSLVGASAMASAASGEQVLVVELGHRASFQGVFGVAHIGIEPLELAPNLFGVNLSAQAALADYFTRHVPSRRLSEKLLCHDSLQRFLQAAPAVTEVAVLDKLEALLAEKDELGQYRYGKVFVDLDATGHALMFLELPEVFSRLNVGGPLQSVLTGFSKLLFDQQQTRLHVITLPEPLPLQETSELLQLLSEKPGLTLGRLFLNKARKPLPALTPAEHRRLAQWGKGQSAFVSRLLALYQSGSAAQAKTDTELQRLREHYGLPLVEVPEIQMEASAGEWLLQLAKQAEVLT